MYISFEQLPNHARVWVYQANRPLTDQENRFIQQEGERFTAQWVAHGQALQSSVTVLHRHFLVIAVDEQQQAPTGCSIDSSVGFVRSAQSALTQQGAKVNFFDRTLIAFRVNDSVELIPLVQAKSQMAEGRIQPDTLMFNNLVTTKAELEKQWQIPVQESWLARYLPKVNA